MAFRKSPAFPRLRNLRRLLRLEPLETRNLLAGNVTFGIVGGNVLVTGDAAANSIQITGDSAASGLVTVSSLDDTTINGGTAPVTLAVLNDLRVNLGGGHDNLQIRGDDDGLATLPRDLTIDLGADDNNLGFLGPYAITRDLKYTGGAGFEDIEIGGVSARDWIFTTGDGPARIDLHDLAIGRNLKATNGAVSDPEEANSLSLVRSNVPGVLTMTQASGVGRLYLGAGPDAANITGNVVVTSQNAAGANNVFFVEGGHVAASLIAHGGGTENFLNLEDMNVTGDVRVTYPSQNSSTSFFSGTVGGNFVANQGVASEGSFAGVLLLAGSIGGSVTIADNALISVVQMGNSGPLTIGGSVSITSPGLGVVYATQTAAVLDFRVNGSAEDDLVILDGVSARSILVNVGAGENDVSLSNFSTVGDVRVTDAGSSSFVFADSGIVGGSVVITQGVLGDGEAAVIFGAMEIASHLTVTQHGLTHRVSADDAPVSVGGNAALSGTGSAQCFLDDVHVTGNLTIANVGETELDIGGNQPVTVGGTARITVSDGVADVQLDNLEATLDVIVSFGAATTSHELGVAMSGPVVVGRDFKFISGEATEFVAIQALTARDISLNLGNGGTEIVLEGIVATRDLIIVQGADGFDLVDPVEVGPEGEEVEQIEEFIEVPRNLLVEIVGATVTQNLTVTSGNLAGELDLRVRATEVQGNAIFTQGDGTVNLNLGDTNSGGVEDNLNVVGSMTITSGEGGHFINLAGGSVGGVFTVRGGDGANIVNISNSIIRDVNDVDEDGDFDEVLYANDPLFGNNVVLEGGFGSNVFLLNSPSIDGSLSVATGSGSSFLLFQGGNVDGNVTVATVPGSNNQFFGGGGPAAVPLTIGGRLSVTNSGESDSLLVLGTSVTGDLLVNNSGSVTLGIAGEGPVAVGGSVRITNAGASNFSANNLLVTLDCIVTLAAASGENELNVGLAAPVVVLRDFKVLGGDASDAITTADLTARDVILSLANGGTHLHLAGITARDLIVIQGNDGFDLVDPPEEGGEEEQVHEFIEVPRNLVVTIAGADLARNLRVTSGNLTGELDLRVKATEVEGNATFTQGDGTVNLNLGDTDVVGVEDNLNVVGSLSITSGEGGHFINITGGAFGGAVAIRGGDGANVVLISTNIVRDVNDLDADEDFDEVLYENFPVFGNNVTLEGGFGSNVFLFNSPSIVGSLSVATGGGSSFLLFQGGNVDANVTVTTTPGSNNQFFGASGPAAVPVTIGGRLSVTNSGPFDTLFVLNTSITGNLLATNSGRVILGIPDAEPVTVGGSVRITNDVGESDVSAENLAVALDFVVDAGDTSSVNVVTLGASTSVTIGRDLILRQGNGFAQAVLLNVDVERNLQILSLDGADYIVLDGASVAGNTLIDTGTGNDVVRLGETQPTDLDNGSVTVRTDEGNDSLLVGDFTSLVLGPAPNFHFDGGEDLLGDDVDEIDLYFALTPATSARILNFETIIEGP